MNARCAALLLPLLVLTAAPRARAQAAGAPADASNDATLERVVVRNRLHTVQGRAEGSLSVGLNALSHLTTHYTLNAGLAYNLFETLALEGRAGYALSRHTGVARSLGENFLNSDRNIARTDELTDLWEMGPHGVVGVRWQPIYGKLSLLSELPAHFQAYLWGGAGVARFTRESVLQCGNEVRIPVGEGEQVVCDNRSDPFDRSTASESYWRTESRVAPVVSAAAGLRFFILERHGARVEVRDWVFRDAYREGVERAQWTQGLESGTPAGSPGLTHIIQFDLGYTFLF